MGVFSLKVSVRFVCLPRNTFLCFEHDSGCYISYECEDSEAVEAGGGAGLMDWWSAGPPSFLLSDMTLSSRPSPRQKAI